MKDITTLLPTLLLYTAAALHADEERHHEEHEHHEHEENHGHHGSEHHLEEEFHRQHMEFEIKRQELDFETEHRLRELDIERQELDLQYMQQDIQYDRELADLVSLFLLLALAVRILLAVWIHLDCRKRQTGSGLWIFIILLGGVLAAIAYGVVRMGDLRAAPPAKATSSRKS